MKIYTANIHNFVQFFKLENNQYYILENGKKAQWSKTHLCPSRIKLLKEHKESDQHKLLKALIKDRKEKVKKHDSGKSDEVFILSFINHFQINYTVYTKKKYLCDKAVKLGAIKCYSFQTDANHNMSDFYVNKNGDIIGFGTDSTDSFSNRLKKEKK